MPSLGKIYIRLDGTITRDQLNSHKSRPPRKECRKNSSFGAVGQLTNLRHSRRAMEWEEAERRHDRRDAMPGEGKQETSQPKVCKTSEASGHAPCFDEPRDKANIQHPTSPIFSLRSAR